MAIKTRQRKDGKTVYDVRVQYGNYRVSRTVPTTLTEAKRVESKILQDLIHGKFDILKKTQNPTLKEYADKYLKSVEWQKSYSRTKLSVKHLVKYFGAKRLTEITANEFINYRTKRLESVGLATINRERSCLLRMLNLAVKNEDFLINKNPISDIKAFKEPPAVNRVLEEEEYHLILEAAPEYFRRILFFACNTGMRKMEILNLQFGQVRIWVKGGGELELFDTKSGEKEYVPLNDEVTDMLAMIAHERNIDIYNLKNTDRKKYVFLSKYGKRLQSVRKPMAFTFKKAGVELRPFHTFRHFWTKMMFEAGVDPATIQKVGRWRDFETMLRYCYTTREQEQEAVRKLSAKLSQRTPKFLKMRQYSGNDTKK